MADFFTMPKQGVDMEEGTLIRWLKNVGDTVVKGDIIAEIETDKTTVEVEVLCSGTIRKFYIEEGETVPCGTPLAFIGSETDEIPDISPKKPEVEAALPEESVPVAPSEEVPVTKTEPLESMAYTMPKREGKLLITPRASKLAKRENIDVNMVVGSGPNGRIVEYDVRQFITAMQSGTLTGIGRIRQRTETVVPFKGVRKATAKHMVESLSSMAQAHMSADINAENLVSLRTQLNKKYESQGKKISYLDLIVLAVAKSLIEHPDANAELKDDGIHQKNYANIGVAVNTDNGLFVPVINDADTFTPLQLDEKIKTIAKKAKEGKLSAGEMTGGTFTVSNLGMYEIDTFAAVINPPETCILAVSRIKDSVIAMNGNTVVKPVMNITLTYDHRLIDGAPAAAFLTTLRHYLENPAWVLV